MIDVTIQADTTPVAEGLLVFLKTYRKSICDYLNLELKDKGQLADCGSIVDGNVIKFVQVATDKGFVLGETDYYEAGGSQLTVQKWSDLGVGKKYVVYTKEGLCCYLKEEDGIPDLKIGEYKDIDDAVNNINSPITLARVKELKEAQEAQKKAIAKAIKLHKIKPKEIKK